MSLSGGVASGADDEGSADLPPRRGKACRVLIFFLYFFGFVIAVPMIAIAIVQAKYGLIDGPPSFPADPFGEQVRSEEHTSELQSLIRISFAVFCLKKKK